MVLQGKSILDVSKTLNAEGIPTTNGKKWLKTTIHNRPGQPPVADHAGNVQRLLHHLARRLGYRRRCLVVTVVPDVDGPGVQPAPFAVQLSLSRAP